MDGKDFAGSVWLVSRIRTKMNQNAYHPRGVNLLIFLHLNPIGIRRFIDVSSHDNSGEKMEVFYPDLSFCFEEVFFLFSLFTSTAGCVPLRFFSISNDPLILVASSLLRCFALEIL